MLWLFLLAAYMWACLVFDQDSPVLTFFLAPPAFIGSALLLIGYVLILTIERISYYSQE